MPMCSSPSVAILISSAVMQSGMYMHDSIALMVMYMLGISLSLAHGNFWIASLQRIVVSQTCIIFLCGIDVLITIFFGACLIGMEHLSCTHGDKSRFPSHVLPLQSD